MSWPSLLLKSAPDPEARVVQRGVARAVVGNPPFVVIQSRVRKAREAPGIDQVLVLRVVHDGRLCCRFPKEVAGSTPRRATPAALIERRKSE